MHIDLLTVEIGSTTTVVHAFDDLGSTKPRLIGQGRALSSIGIEDIYLAVEAALADLAAQFGETTVTADLRTASSSAAGGLRITVHGLAYEMTVRAAREAALGAGAVVKMVTAGKLNSRQLQQVIELRPNLILLAGGVDFGDEEVPYHNGEVLAQALAAEGLEIPLIYAGNSALQRDMVRIMENHGQQLFLCDNVYPQVDQLHVEPARHVIQHVFEKHIVTAPGMERVKSEWGTTLWPTPAAVMQSAQLFAKHCGDVVVVDVGGATTDVHSVTEGSSEVQTMLLAPEPTAKRTVEGDLGVFYNSPKLLDLHSRQDPTLSGTQWQPVAIPKEEADRDMVLTLAQTAVAESMRRHVGRLLHHYGPSGRQTWAKGKDLTAVKYIVGTGGVFAYLDPDGSLLRIFLQPQKDLLLPKKAAIAVDHRYIMAAVGTVIKHAPQEAWQLLQASLFPQPSNHS